MTRAQRSSRAGVAPAVEVSGGGGRSIADLDRHPGFAGDAPLAPARATPSDSLFRRDGLYVMAASLQFVGGLALTPLMTRLLGPADYGMVTTSMIIMQAVFQVAGLSLATGLQRSYAHLGRENARRLLGFAMVTTLAITLLLDLTGPLWVHAFGLSDYGGASRFAVWWGGASAIATAQTSLLRSEDKLAGYAILMALQSVLADAAGLAICLYLDASATLFVAGKLAATALGAVVGLGYITPAPFGTQDRARIRDCLTFSLALVPAALAALVISSFDRITLAHAHGATEVARYQIAALLGTAPVLLLMMLASSWMPRFFALGVVGDTEHTLVRARDSLYQLLPWVLLGVAGLAPFVLRLWAPASFHTDELVLISAVVALATVPEAATAVATQGLLSAGRSVDVSRGLLAAAVTNVAWNLVAVPRWGLLGSATAVVAGFSVGMLVTTYLARRVGYRPGLSRRTPLIAAAAAAAVGLAALPAGNGQNWACGAAVVLATTFGLRAVWQVTR